MDPHGQPPRRDTRIRARRTSTSFSTTSGGRRLSKILLPTSDPEPDAAARALGFQAGAGRAPWFPRMFCLCEW